MDEKRRSHGVPPMARAVAVALAAVLGSACRNGDVTDATAARKAPTSEAGHIITTPIGTYSIPIPETNAVNDGVQPIANTGVIIPAGTYYRVRVNGTATATSNPAWDCAGGAPIGGTYGPNGSGYYSQLQVQLRARNTDGSGTNSINFLTSWPDSVRSDILYASKQIEVQAGRNGIGALCNHNNGTPVIPGFLLSASQSVYVEQVTDAVHLVANPSYVHANQQVTFTASRDGGGNLGVQGWHWQPDPGQPGNPSNPCWWNNPCQMNIPGSGTMTVNTSIGAATAHVTVFTNFQLVADKSSATDGDTVTFTAKYDGVPGPAGRWKWIPDAPAPDSTACPNNTGPCNKAVMQSGTMWAYSATSGGDSDSKHVTITIPELTLYAHFQSGPAGRAVTFTPRWPDERPVIVTSWSWTPDSVGGATAACAGTPAVCQTAVSEKGTMTVTATRAGVTKTASVHVTVVPCATGDTLLDTEAVRMGLSTIDIVSRSAPIQYRHEQGVYFFEDTLTGEVSALLNFTNYSDHCSWSDPPWPSTPANSRPVARGHSHPYDPSIDTLPAGVTCAKKTLHQRATPHWGLNKFDDGVAADGWPGFAIDADSIYRTDGPGMRHSWPRVINGCSLLPPVQLKRLPPKPGLLPPSAPPNTSKQTSLRSTRRTAQ